MPNPSIERTRPGKPGRASHVLRLGQCKFEKAEFDFAVDHLARAYMLEGKEIFGEDSPKYFEFLKTKLEPPESGEW